MALTKVKGHIIADDLALGGNPTTSTQSASDNSTKIATTAYVTTAVSNLVDGAPSTLNTLNEIAAALNDDAALNTTLTNSIATKAPLASPTFTGNVSLGAASASTGTLYLYNSGNDSRMGILNTGSEFQFESTYLTNAGYKPITFKTGGSERMRITSAGDVKVGALAVSSATTAPLIVAKASTDVQAIFGDNNASIDDPSIRIIGRNTANNAIRYTFLGLDADTNHGYLGYNAGAGGFVNALNFDTSGNVGIGTTSPTNKLEIEADSAHLRLQGATTTTKGLALLFDNSNNRSEIRSDQAGVNQLDLQYYALNHKFGRNASLITMTLTDTGNVGIGTTAPTQKLDVAGTALLENAKLKAIAKSNSDTAVDVFIYDTSKDSDGGAWRKRTRNTSWYNETLNTSTRGARKEFPSVAVIIVENTKLRIYDGDDPDMPMWMVFDTNAKDMLGGHDAGGGSWLGKVAAVNGNIAVTSYSGYAPYLFNVNFISEIGYMWHYTNGRYRYNGNISTRNNADGMYVEDSTASIVFLYCRDVAMTVLPNAPVDIETGLPKPTIAVGTDRGVSIIKDTENIVDITASAGTAYGGVTWVDITKNDNLIFEQDNSSNPRSIFCIPIPSADRTSATSDGIINDKVVMKFYRGGTHKPYPCFNGAGVNEAVALEGDNQLLRSNTAAGGDLTILEPNLVSPALGKVAYIGHDYNSGWLVGDTKVATLSDTSTTSATSPDLVTNGSNFTNTTGWTGQSATVSVSSSELLVTGTASINSNQSATWTTISCAKGDQFQVTFRISAFVANQSSAGIIVGGATIHRNNDLGYWYPNTAATHTTTVTATSTTFTLYLHAGISVGVVTRFDDISIHKLQNDRTQYKHGFQTFGTLAKSVVATGAELVGYGPFSASNYLQQSYTSELDFNSGDFAYCFWSNNPHTGSNYICDRSEGNGNYRIAIYLTTTEVAFYTRDSAATEVAAAISTPNQWTQIWCIRRGTSHEIWVNGVNKVATNAAVRDVSNASGDAVQVIGTRYNQDGPNPGKIALLRVSGTVPSEEQIVKIYNDERKLFEINSDATMGGSSSAATVLAYDDVREEMHVGSSWGRSVFQGLSRVEFDSDVPTTSLSVNDGFVVEE